MLSPAFATKALTKNRIKSCGNFKDDAKSFNKESLPRLTSHEVPSWIRGLTMPHIIR